MKKYLAFVFLGISLILNGCYAHFSSRDYGYYDEYDSYGYYEVGDYVDNPDTTEYAANQIGDYIGSDTTVYMTEDGRVIEINNYFTVAENESAVDSESLAYKPGARKYYLDYYPSTHLTIATYNPYYSFWYDPWIYDPWYYDYWYYSWNYYPSYWYHYPHWGFYGYYPSYYGYYGGSSWAYTPSQYKYRDNYRPRGGDDRSRDGSGSGNVGIVRGDIGGEPRDPGTKRISHLEGDKLRDLDVARIDPKSGEKGSTSSKSGIDKNRGNSPGEVSDVKKIGDVSKTKGEVSVKDRSGFEISGGLTEVVSQSKTSREFQNNKKLLDALKNKIADNPKGSSPAALRELVNNGRTGKTNSYESPVTRMNPPSNNGSRDVPNYNPPPATRNAPNSGRTYGESTPSRRTSPPKSYTPPRTNSSPKSYSPPKSSSSSSKSYSAPRSSSGSSKSSSSGSRSSSSSSRSSSGSKSRK